MARLSGLEGLAVGDVRVAGVGPVPVELEAEVLPFEMPISTSLGLNSSLAARSLLWSSRSMGIVAEDREGLFHAVATDVPRPQLGDSVSFAPRELSKLRSVELVALPLVQFEGSARGSMMTSPCHVASDHTALRPRTTAGLALQQEIKSAVAKWVSWWTRNVEARQEPPQPPKEVSDPFVKAVAALLATPESEIAVVSRRDEMISDKVSIDLFERGVRGQGGSTRADIDKRIKDAKGGRIDVILQIQADAFDDRDSILGVLGTAIHEAAHYRHYVLTRQLIERWQATRRGKKPRPVTEDVLRTEFGKFLDAEVKAKRLSQSGRVVVHSTFGVQEATHPFAQIHGFMGAYPHYPRERSGKGNSGGLLGQPRFRQLMTGAQDWNRTTHPIMNDLPFTALVAHAKDIGRCAVSDLHELSAEVAADKHHKSVAPFFAKLAAALSTG